MVLVFLDQTFIFYFDIAVLPRTPLVILSAPQVLKIVIEHISMARYDQNIKETLLEHFNWVNHVAEQYKDDVTVSCREWAYC